MSETMTAFSRPGAYPVYREPDGSIRRDKDGAACCRRCGDWGHDPASEECANCGYWVRTRDGYRCCPNPWCGDDNWQVHGPEIAPGVTAYTRCATCGYVDDPCPRCAVRDLKSDDQHDGVRTWCGYCGWDNRLHSCGAYLSDDWAVETENGVTTYHCGQCSGMGVTPPPGMTLCSGCELPIQARGYQYDPADNSAWCPECWPVRRSARNPPELVITGPRSCSCQGCTENRGLCYRPPPLHEPVFKSPVEKMFWDAFGDAEREFLAPQYLVTAEGFNFYLDFAVPGLKLGIEIDGHATHSSPRDIARDRIRQRMLERAGWKIIRFGGAEVWHDARRCAQEAREFILREAGGMT